MTYRHAYPGCFTMQIFDGLEDLRRWFDNWKVNRTEAFSDAYEYLLIEEKKFTTARGRERVRYVGSVGAEDQTTRRVEFDHTAPPPPSFYAKPRLTRVKMATRPARYGSWLEEMENDWMSREFVRSLKDDMQVAHQDLRDLRVRHLIEMESLRPKTFYSPDARFIKRVKMERPAPAPDRYRRNT